VHSVVRIDRTRRPIAFDIRLTYLHPRSQTQHLRKLPPDPSPASITGQQTTHRPITLQQAPYEYGGKRGEKNRFAPDSSAAHGPVPAIYPGTIMHPFPRHGVTRKEVLGYPPRDAAERGAVPCSGCVVVLDRQQGPGRAPSDVTDVSLAWFAREADTCKLHGKMKRETRISPVVAASSCATASASLSSSNRRVQLAVLCSQPLVR